MKRNFFLTLSFMIGLVSAAWGQNDSGSNLDRLTLRTEILGWEAVGRVDVAGSGFCTGTLIETDLVLTAAHCLFRGNGEPVNPALITFKAGLVDGAAVAQSKVLRAVVHPEFTKARQDKIISVHHDVALLQLESPIAAATAAPFKVGAPSNRRAVSVVSYGKGREEAPSWERSCGMLDRKDGLMAFDCDVYLGSSGAPVFDRQERRPNIISIISSGRREDSGTVSFGMELPRLVESLRTQLAAGNDVIGAPVRPVARIRRLGSGDSTRDIGALFVKP